MAKELDPDTKQSIMDELSTAYSFARVTPHGTFAMFNMEDCARRYGVSPGDVYRCRRSLLMSGNYTRVTMRLRK